MKRTVTVEYSPVELRVMRRLERARDLLRQARKDHADAIRQASDLGLPVRVIGEKAGVSGAHVSRLVNDRYVIDRD